MTVEIYKEFKTILQEIVIDNFSSSLLRVKTGLSYKCRNFPAGYKGNVWWIQKPKRTRFFFWDFEVWKTIGMIDLYRKKKSNGEHIVYIDCFEVKELKNIRTYATALEKKLDEETADDYLKIKSIQLLA